MTRMLNNRPVVLLAILAGVASIGMTLIPSAHPAGVWIITAIGIAIGTILIVRPDRSGVPAHLVGIRLTGFFILCVFAVLVARDLINVIQGAN
jgi:hypothetical protein